MAKQSKTTEQVETAGAASTVNEQPTGQEAPQLTINDLATLKNIVDLASQRGAFKPNEMVVVGQTYIKLTTFLDAVTKQAEESTSE